MWFFIIGIITLYVFYRVLGAWLMPILSEKRMKKYQEEFYKQNPHIDRVKVEQQFKESEKSAIIDKRKNGLR